MTAGISKTYIGVLLGFAFIAGFAITLVSALFSPLFYFEVYLRSSSPGIAQTFYDIGNGVNEQNSQRLPVPASNSMAVYKFPLPEGDYHAIRFDPLDHGNAEMLIRGARIVDISGRTVRAFSLTEFSASNGLFKFDSASGAMSLSLGPADVDSILSENFSHSLPLYSGLQRWVHYGEIFLLSFLAVAGVGLLWLISAPAIWRKARPIALKIVAMAKQHPRRAIGAV